MAAKKFETIGNFLTFFYILPKGFMINKFNLNSMQEKVISLMSTTSNIYYVNTMEVTVVRIATLDSGLPVDVMCELYCLYKTICMPVFQHDYCQQSSTRG